MTPRLIRAGRTMIAGLSTVLVLSIPGPAYATGQSDGNVNNAPPPDRITVDVRTVNGSGCPAGTASVRTSSDNTAFRVTYQNYVAIDGPGGGPTDFRKNCQLNLGIHVPQGFTFAIARVDYRGFAHLRSGARGTLRAAYYFMGSSDTLNLDHTLTGPYSAPFHATDITAVAELVFAACGKDVGLNVNTSLLVNSPSGTSFMAMNSTTGDIDTIFHFHWKRC